MSAAAHELAQLCARPIAHRGLHGCGAGPPVENSLGAARAAIAAGYGIECDVRLSRDGEAMVFHDAELRRLTGRPGPLDDHDAADLGRLRLGGGDDVVPTLRDLLAAIDGRVALVVEIKADAGGTRLADRVLDLLDSYRGPAAIESFDPALVRHCRSKRTARPLGLVGPPETGAAADPAVAADCDFLSWSIAHLATAAKAHPGKVLTSWTVRTPAEVEAAARHGAQIVFEGFHPPLTLS